MDLTLTALTGSVNEVDETWFSEAADEFLATWTLLRTCLQITHFVIIVRSALTRAPYLRVAPCPSAVIDVHAKRLAAAAAPGVTPEAAFAEVKQTLATYAAQLFEAYVTVKLHVRAADLEEEGADEDQVRGAVLPPCRIFRSADMRRQRVAPPGNFATRAERLRRPAGGGGHFGARATRAGIALALPLAGRAHAAPGPSAAGRARRRPQRRYACCGCLRVHHSKRCLTSDVIRTVATVCIVAAACAPISEAAHWLVLLAGHVLADSSIGQKPLIPASLMQAIIAHERVRYATACGVMHSALAIANRNSFSCVCQWGAAGPSSWARHGAAADRWRVSAVGNRVRPIGCSRGAYKI